MIQALYTPLYVISHRLFQVDGVITVEYLSWNSNTSMAMISSLEENINEEID